MQTVTNMPHDGGMVLDQAQSFWAGFGELQSELLRFAMGRIEKDGELIRSAMGSRNPTDMLALQSRWLSQAVEDYSAEATKVATILTRATSHQGAGAA